MKQSSLITEWRLISLLFAVSFLFLVVFARLAHIQLGRHSYYSVKAAQQHWGGRELPSERGRILSSDGSPLVENHATYLLYVEPPKISDAKDVADKLAAMFVTDEEVAKDKDARKTESNRVFDLINGKLQWGVVKRNLSEVGRDRVQSLGLSGLGFLEEPARYYPEESLAAHLLGFVGQNNNGVDVGYYGLEGFYNGDLKGVNGKLAEETDNSGNPIPIGEVREIEPQNGRDLLLTLDRSVQYLVERKLSEAVGKYGAKSGTVIIMEPQTGAIISMASSPAYDPSNPEPKKEDEASKSANPEPWKNPAISMTYEPGSVFKALTMSAGVDTSTVTPETTFNDSGPITVSGYKVDTWNHQHHGEESMIQVLQHSCNIGASWVAEKLGSEILRDYQLKFGLGKPLGIDLEGEETGTVKPLSEWRPIDLANASFGQGVSVTPLQLISIFATIINDGVQYKPYIVSEIHDGDKVIKNKPQELRRVISSQTSKTMVEMLTAAVEGGESKFYNLKDHRIGGKTGTAQIPVNGTYDPNKSNATFVGFLPSYPKFVMLTLLQEPSSSIYASETAVPLFMDVMRDLVAYYGIKPDK